MAEIESTLEERGKRYGKFTGHAKASQSIQASIEDGFMHNDNFRYGDMDDDMKEALLMIAHKIGRIVNGDPWYADSWHDIAGYATLVANRLENKIEQ